MKSTWLVSIFVASALLAVGCGNDTASGTDAGTDLGTSDSGNADLGTTDLGTTDLGTDVDMGEAAAVVEVSCDGLDPAATVTASVGDGFVEPAVVVAPGGTVKFQNADSFPHTVTSADSIEGTPTANGIFDGALAGSGSVCFRFDATGTFPYFCSIHTSMRGSVAVGNTR